MHPKGLRETILALRPQYRTASKTEKASMLDSLCRLHAIHRKHLIRLLRDPPDTVPRPVGRPCVYQPAALLEPLIAIWKATNLVCGKRLAA
jgi:hypothetical protein